jgi:transposase-like protein
MNTKVESGKPLTVQPSITLSELMTRFEDEDACKAYLRDARWPNGVRCPRCANDHVYALKQPFKWQCQKCTPKGYRFSVITGTIFENTKYPLSTWFRVAYLMTQSKKGVSALQIHRQIGSGDYRTAWFMCHRLRAAMENETFEKLAGEVEVDEAYVGGKRGNKHAKDRDPHERGPHGKAAVLGAISRKGSVVAKVVERLNTDAIESFVNSVVDKRVKLVSTDESPMYRRLKERGYAHEQVDHKNEKYVVGLAHTNSIESLWSLLKR